MSVTGWHIQRLFESPASTIVDEPEAWLSPRATEDENQIILHHFTTPTSVEFRCALDGCDEMYRIMLYPGQHVYPKFCEKHRSEFRRLNFNRSHVFKLAS